MSDSKSGPKPGTTNALQMLITGALGFVGTNLCKYFSRKFGYHVTGCDDLSFGREENRQPGVFYNIQSFEKYSTRELSRFDIVIHAATCNIIFSQENPSHTVLVNDVLTQELFSRIPPSAHIIYLSTASVYGNSAKQPLTEDDPISLTNVYATTKYAAEMHLKRGMHHKYTILRLSNVYGPFQSPENPYCGVMGKLMESAMAGSDFSIYGDGSATRDYTYAGDVCKAVEAALKSPMSHGETFNIATGQEHNVFQLTQFVRHIAGTSHFQTKHVSPRGIDTVNRRCLSPQRAKAMIGWEADTLLYQGIEKTLAWDGLKKIF